MLIKSVLHYTTGCLLIFSLSTTLLYGQAELPRLFQEKLQDMQIDIAIPVENTFKRKRSRKQDFFQADYVLRAKRSKVEIHYSLIPTENAENLVPQVSYTITLANLARNEEDQADIAVHQMEAVALEEQFNADWGSIAYFHPKPQIGRYQHGKLLALFKAGQGMVYVLFLFDQGNEETIESLSQAVRFTTIY